MIISSSLLPCSHCLWRDTLFPKAAAPPQHPRVLEGRPPRLGFDFQLGFDWSQRALQSRRHGSSLVSRTGLRALAGLSSSASREGQSPSAAPRPAAAAGRRRPLARRLRWPRASIRKRTFSLAHLLARTPLPHDHSHSHPTGSPTGPHHSAAARGQRHHKQQYARGP